MLYLITNVSSVEKTAVVVFCAFLIKSWTKWKDVRYPRSAVVTMTTVRVLVAGLILRLCRVLFYEQTTQNKDGEL